MKKEHKVYVYCDPRFTNKGKGYEYTFGNKGRIKLKYKPFYIGAAKGDSYKRHLKPKSSSNRLVQKRILKLREKGLEPIIKIIKNFNSRERALILEEKLIIGVGRKDLETGPLLNQTDGPGIKNPSIKARKEITKRNKKIFRDHPEYLKRASERLRKKFNSPGVREEYSQRMTIRLLEDSEFRKIIYSPEAGRKRSKSQKKNWENEEFKEKMIKIIRKSRLKIRGELNKSSKLVESKVLKIRKLRKKGVLVKDLVKKFEVSVSAIERVIYRKTWKHI